MSSRAIAASWLRTRLAMRRSAPGLARRRARLWQDLAPTLARTPALRLFAGRPLDDVPVTDAAELRTDYGCWNSLGCTHEALVAAAEDAERGGPGEVRPGVVAGFSTGQGGRRGLFVADAAERADYLGQAMARLLSPGDLARTLRLAVLLRANSRLYSDSASGRRSFLHLPLAQPLSETCLALQQFSPTIVIAASSRLVDLAAEVSSGRLALPGLTHLFYGAEPLGEAERDWIAGVFGTRPDPIHQATEGFIAAACPGGFLHLNEHSLEIELELVPGTDGFRPVLTDLRRTSQPIVRVRTDDFLELDLRSCRCGYAGRVIRPVMGRVGEIWRFDGGVTVTPRRLSEVMDGLLEPPLRWQAVARVGEIELRLDPAIDPARAGKVAHRLQQRLDLPVPVSLSRAPPDPPSPKRRRMGVEAPARA